MCVTGKHCATHRYPPTSSSCVEDVLFAPPDHLCDWPICTCPCHGRNEGDEQRWAEMLEDRTLAAEIRERLGVKISLLDMSWREVSAIEERVRAEIPLLRASGKTA